MPSVLFPSAHTTAQIPTKHSALAASRGASHFAARYRACFLCAFVAEVHPLSNYCLSVKFLDGTTGEVDMSKLVTSEQAGVFAKLCDQTFFAKVFVEYGAVTWPGEIDLAPDAMYKEIKQHGKWIL